MLKVTETKNGTYDITGVSRKQLNLITALLGYLSYDYDDEEMYDDLLRFGYTPPKLKMGRNLFPLPE